MDNFYLNIEKEFSGIQDLLNEYISMNIKHNHFKKVDILNNALNETIKYKQLILDKIIENKGKTNEEIKAIFNKYYKKINIYLKPK